MFNTNIKLFWVDDYIIKDDLYIGIYVSNINTAI